MAGAFPELKKNPSRVAAAIEDEEKQFIRTLDKGIKLFAEVAERVKGSGSKTVSGEDAFTLHDTYGIYLDITQQMAEEAGLKVDLAGYESAMKAAKDKEIGRRRVGKEGRAREAPGEYEEEE